MKKVWKTIVLLGCLMAALMLTACGGGGKIDLSKYVTIDVSGPDGQGVAECYFDTDKLLKDYGSKLKFSKELQAKMKDLKDHDYESNNYYVIEGYFIDPHYFNNELMTSPSEVFDDNFSVIAAITSEGTLDLEELKEEFYVDSYYYDVLDAMTTWSPMRMMVEFLSGSLNRSTGLSNGDVVTFSWDISEENAQKINQYFNYSFDFSDIQKTVEGLKREF